MDPPPPLKRINISWSKCATAHPKNKLLQLCTATAPPSLEFPDGDNGCRRGWGWGWGCRGRGRQSWGWGVKECMEGECGNS